MIPGGDVFKHIRWGIDNVRKYRSSDYFKVTPKFLLSELLSRSTRISHYEDFSKHIEDQRFNSLSEEEKADIISARLFASRELIGTRDMGRFELMDYAISSASIDGLWAEFGVYTGKSLRHIASRTKNTVHGFDSFKGLPEDWNRFHGKGHFAVGSGIPTVPGNARLHAGWFSETLPKFRKEIGTTTIGFLHVDCDLYSSTMEIFRYLKDNIVRGSVILFDEYYNYPGWMNHEYRAFSEFIESTGLSYEYIGHNSKAEQVAVLIK